jgi:uncharacterized membrane protein YeaQ/YmgE (transglycosylase-associated protein family)
MVMSVAGWLVLGLIAGFIASRIVNQRGAGIPLDIALGVVGALTGGWLFRNAAGTAGMTGFNVWSLFVAVVGAVVLLVVWHAARGLASHA